MFVDRRLVCSDVITLDGCCVRRYLFRDYRNGDRAELVLQVSELFANLSVINLDVVMSCTGAVTRVGAQEGTGVSFHNGVSARTHNTRERRRTCFVNRM